VKRLVNTSTGHALIELDRIWRAGVHVSVTTFGADGWQQEDRSWYERQPPNPPREELSAFLVYHVGIPLDEAKSLADEIMGPWLAEWERRGGAQDAKHVGRLAVGFTSVLVVLLALSVVAIGLLVWLLAT
jgi:hypothetical protein